MALTALIKAESPLWLAEWGWPTICVDLEKRKPATDPAGEA
jgi:exo-beta-1,3-glucanase (GH17 family)